MSKSENLERSDRSGFIGVAVCSSDALLVDGIAALIESEHGLAVFVRSHNLTETFTACRNFDIAVVVIDATGLTKSDLDLLPGARAVASYKLLALASKSDPKPSNVDRVVDRNARGQTLVDAVRDLGQHGGGMIRETRRSYSNPMHLTNREYDVAGLIARGYSNRRISEALEIREQSVKNLVSVIMGKLGCDNRVQVALMVAPESSASRAETR